MSGLVIAAMVAAVLAGAITMRVTGMGFSLVAAPFLVLALGPREGVLVANVCGTVSALLNLTQLYRQVDWRRVAWLIPAGLAGVWLGGLVVHRLSAALLAVVVSVLVLIGLLLTVLGRRAVLSPSPVVAGAAGLAAGFMTATAAVGGPALVIYALATRWQQARFAATAQLYFAVLGGAAVVQLGGPPAIPLPGWLALAAALALGLVAGSVLARHLNAQQAMRLVVGVATLGALLSLVQGLRAL